jgi:hypothetical protein
MAYTKTTWANNTAPAINADNLNKMEQGIYDAQFPTGGSVGNVLKKTANGTEWAEMTVDTSMSDSSTNAVQNKVIKYYIDNNGITNEQIDALFED